MMAAIAGGAASASGEHAVLRAVAFAAERFLVDGDWEADVGAVLARLAEAVDVSRVYLFENRAAADGEVLARQRAEWVAPGVAPRLDDPEPRDFPLRAGGFARWIERLGGGDTVQGRVASFPPGEHAALEARGILSILVVPVEVGGAWWGFLGFDDCTAERDWRPDEVRALRTAAGILGAAIQRSFEGTVDPAAAGVSVHAREAGDRKRADAALRAIFDHAHVGIVRSDAEGRIVEANPAFARMLGREPGEPDGWTIEGLTHPDDLEAGLVLFRELVAGARESLKVEKRLRRPDGGVVWARINASAVRDDEDRFLYAVAVVEDVTERRAAEAELSRSEERYRQLFEENIAGSFVSSVDGRILACNPAFARIFGFGSVEEALAADPAALYARPEERTESLERIRRERVLTDYEMELRRIDGGTIRVVENVVGTFDEAGELVELRGYLYDITEQKRAEEALRRSEQHFRSLTENALDIITVLNPGGTVRYGSPSVQRVLGWAAEEIVGRSLLEFVHPEDAAGVYAVFTQGMQAPGFSASLEFRFRHKDGSWRVLEAVGKSLIDDPAVTGIVMNSRDVTERRSSEEARRRLGAILEAATDLVGTTDAHGRMLYMNRAGRRMVGLEPDEDAADHSLPDFYPAWAAALLLRTAIPAAIRDGVWSGETALLGPDGEELPVSQVIVAHKTAGGTLEFLSTIARDISERKLAEEALRRSEEHFRSLIDNALDIIAIMEPTGTVRFASPSIERALGYAPRDLLGRNALELLHPDDAAGVAETLARVGAAAGTTVSVEARVRHADGSWRTIEAHGQNLLDDPAVAGIVVNARDVTERKEAEEALRRSEEQFRQAQKMEAVGRLAGGVAHDFNNLLTAIKGHTRLLLADLDSRDPMWLSVEEIDKAAERAASLTRQLLAFSRKQVLQPKVLDLNAVVLDMENMLRRLIGEHIELVTSLAPDIGRIKADPGQIEQVIMNLAVNARDAMPYGGRLTIATSRALMRPDPTAGEDGAPERDSVLLTIVDTGVGMDAPTRQHVFEPFFTTKEKGKGTGLGLSTVYGIVKQSGGTIEIDSVVGQGTAFEIQFPAVADPAEPIAGSTRPASVPRGSETILVAEDEDAVRGLVRGFLQRSGYHVLEARNGHDALFLAQMFDGAIHLLLTDVVMPGMNGRELAQRLRERRPDTRIMFMSGYTDDDLIQFDAFGPGTIFLQKPFAPETLAQKVRHVLDLGRVDAGASGGEPARHGLGHPLDKSL